MEKEHLPADLLNKLGRALFDLPTKSFAGVDSTPPSAFAPLKGWRSARLPDGSWESLNVGRNPKALLQELVNPATTFRARSGVSWDATVIGLVERASERTSFVRRYSINGRCVKEGGVIMR